MSAFGYMPKGHDQPGWDFKTASKAGLDGHIQFDIGCGHPIQPQVPTNAPSESLSNSKLMAKGPGH
jgi:hypothetical protein